jgi:hypothetical protein
MVYVREKKVPPFPRAIPLLCLLRGRACPANTGLEDAVPDVSW